MARRLDVGPGWAAMMGLLFYLCPDRVFGAFLAAAVCHELGHAAVLVLLGVRLDGLRLRLGGAELVTGPMDYRRELLCALAGPAAGLAALLARRRFPAFALFSLALTAYNLLPLWPLDGGRALRAALLLTLPEQTARRISALAGIAACLALAAGALYLSIRLHAGLWPVLLAALSCLRAAPPWKNGL